MTVLCVEKRCGWVAVCCPTNNETNISYTYDADGNVVTSDKTSYLSIQNPFRYRGYYYDNETGLYYLQSRYYDPVTCRFVNADNVNTINDNLLGTGDKKLYSYCGNNSIIKGDDCGEWAHIVVGAVVSGIFELGSQLLSNGGNFKDVNQKMGGIEYGIE